MNDDAVETLKKLIATHGIDLCTNWPRLEGFLRDYAGQHRREINVLVAAARQGIAEDLLKVKSQVDLLSFNRLVQRLYEETGIAREFAEWAVSSWMTVLGIGVQDVADERSAGENLSEGGISVAGLSIEISSKTEAYDQVRQILETLTGGIRTEARSPDGCYLAAYCYDSTIHYWDIVNRRELYQLKSYMHRAPTFVMNYWKVITNLEVSQPESSEEGEENWFPFGCCYLEFSPDGRYLAIVSTVVHLWEIGVEQRAWQLRRLEWDVECMTFSPDGKYLVIGGRCPDIELWDVKTRCAVWEIENDISGGTHHLAFSADGRYLVSVGDGINDHTVTFSQGVVQVWDVTNGCEIWRQKFATRELPGGGHDKPTALFTGEQHLTIKGSDGTTYQQLEFKASSLPDPVTARVWDGRRRKHSWDWADPNGSLPERDQETRKRLEERYTLYRAGVEYYNKDNYDMALKAFTGAIERVPGDADSYWMRGRCYYSKEDYDRAIRDFTQAIGLGPIQADWYAWRGVSYYGIASYDQAIVDMNRAIQHNPKVAWYYHWRSRIYRAMGETAQADSDQRRACELGYKE